jgi:hypothetical protein
MAIRIATETISLTLVMCASQLCCVTDGVHPLKLDKRLRLAELLSEWRRLPIVEFRDVARLGYATSCPYLYGPYR